MTTFTTKNQSRKRYYRAIGATIVVIILVTFIILSRRDRNVSNSSSTNSQRKKNGADGKHRNSFYSDELIEYEPLVELPGLQIKGQVRTITTGKMVASYLAIPYAEPPINNNRFSSPQIKQYKNKNTTMMEAFYQPTKCYQSAFILSITEVKTLGEESKEDCLYLNIWAPFTEECDDCNKTTRKTEKPVMVFIHSGLFQFGGIGSPDLDPSLLVAKKDIIVVTIQYRLGIFGFGSTESESVNESFQSLGLQDQAKALEWIHKNIRAFGGDPNQITISGHGAGAISIGFHLINNRTNKMFKRAIVQGVQNIWNIGIYGMNAKSVRFLMDDSNCDEQTVNDRDMKACIAKTRIQPIVFLEGQQYLFDTFAIPFVPEYNPLTKQVAEKVQGLVAEARFNETLLETIFNQWNIFSPEHEIMIGINSDDDYQFEKVNKVTTKIYFGDHDNEEEDEDYEDEEGDSNDGEEKMKDEEKPNNNDDHANDDESDAKKKNNEKTEEETFNIGEKIRNNTNIKNENESTTAATTSTIDVMIQSRRRRRRRQTANGDASKLDKDEIIKMCRLVKMYRIQKKRVPNVSPHVILYRIDPKVLVNLLEEVSFAFGAKSNWLKGLEKDTINLWGSFVTNGLAGLKESNAILSKYDSKIASRNDPVNLINIGQMKEDDNRSQLSITTFDWNTLCSVQT